jgi:sugar lactone lactonase YvrE
LYQAGAHNYDLVDGWAKLPAGWSFTDVCDVAIDASDRVFIVNRSPHPVMVFDREGKFLYSFGEGFFKRAHGCCITRDGLFYCTDDENHTVSSFTLDGTLLSTIGRPGKASDTGYHKKSTVPEGIATIVRGAPPFNRPTGVALNSKGEIFVSDGYGNARIHKFSSDGELLLSWGEPGTGPGQFRLPHSVWVDRNDRLWITDWQNNRLQIFSENGEFIEEWTDLAGPSDIFIDDNNIVYVSEEEWRISILDEKGTLLGRWDSQGEPLQKATFHAPHCIAVDSRGDIYVGEVSFAYRGFDKGPRTIQKFARTA